MLGKLEVGREDVSRKVSTRKTDRAICIKALKYKNGEK